ncbi:MAG: hypothetical protein QM734_08210 [Cyclobacteriaceae bacterium]
MSDVVIKVENVSKLYRLGEIWYSQSLTTLTGGGPETMFGFYRVSLLTLA